MKDEQLVSRCCGQYFQPGWSGQVHELLSGHVGSKDQCCSGVCRVVRFSSLTSPGWGAVGQHSTNTFMRACSKCP